MKKNRTLKVICILLLTGFQLRSFSQVPLQFTLIDASVTMDQQAFVDISTGNISKTVYNTPAAGYKFCLFEIETTNPNKDDIDLKGSEIRIASPEGTIECYGLFSIQGYSDRFIPLPSMTLTVKRKKSRTDKFLAVMKEDVQSFDFIYRNSDTLTIVVAAQ